MYNNTHIKKEKIMAKRKINPALMKPLTPSAKLAEVIGSKPLARAQAIKKT
jgi:chromatin remodeling complex protein RSC6